MSEFSLVKLTILKVAELLKKCYWPVFSTQPNNFCVENPFVYLPPSIVEDILSTVVQLTAPGTLSVRDIFPILSSGRIKNFKLEDIFIPSEELVGILTALSVNGHNLISLVLRKLYCATSHSSKMKPLKSSALECLLTMAPCLEYLHVDIEFDLKTIRRSMSLKQIELNFVPKTQLCDLLPKVDDSTFADNMSLTHISVYEGMQNTINFKEIALLLKHCPQLIYFENSIAEALEYLHSDELYSGSLSKVYKLKKCTLGNAFLGPDQAAASATAVHIATVTCPFIKSLEALVDDHQGIIAFRDFMQLSSLLVQWAFATPGDFRLGLKTLLEQTGHQYKVLSIINFSYVDFSVIAAFCPNLELLKVEHCGETLASVHPDVCLKKMEVLHVECLEDNIGTREESLRLLLSHCLDLQALCIENMPALTDDVLKAVLKKNALAKLKETTILNCSLSEIGLQSFVNSCPALEYFCFSSSRISFDFAATVVHQINPFIIMQSDIV